MGSIGVAVAILGGVVAMLVGLGRSDWAEIGIGLGIIGLAVAIGDGLLGPPFWRAAEPAAEPDATPTADDEHDRPA